MPPSCPARPHPANSPGDFYVEDGCCLICGVPLDEASGLFAWADDSERSHCVVARQPRTAEEIDRVLAAMWAAEMSCIRYRGSDPVIGRRIVEMGHADLCDHPPPTDATPLIRSHASFRAIDGMPPVSTALLAEDFIRHFVQPGEGGRRRCDAEPVRIEGTRAIARISWCEEVFHAVEFDGLEHGRWLVVTRPHPEVRAAWQGLSRVVERWIHSSGRFEDVRWFSGAQWRAGGPFRWRVI